MDRTLYEEVKHIPQGFNRVRYIALESDCDKGSTLTRVHTASVWEAGRPVRAICQLTTLQE